MAPGWPCAKIAKAAASAKIGCFIDLMAARLRADSSLA
ncbi:hypothetical protein BN2497_11929 [Janthinobacterium sp. CG23_2]|nr:hypothetical protein BN2497_11929 [Janthinobacterium sp. CG23_2]CUU32362.1 hypothetical protein BN3177_11929 [Janthinobacterium sp. CG23_2]